MSLLYLARPIDQAPDCVPWWRLEERRISRDLAAAGHDVYRPAQAFRASVHGPSAQIQLVNRAALAQCAGGVALLPQGVPSWGTPAEIEHLISTGRLVLIVSEFGRSAQLQDWKERGAIVCTPAQIEQGLLQLVHELAQEPDLVAATPPLVFEPVAEGDLPTRGYPSDAGLDLVVCQDIKIEPGSFADVPCGVKVDIPDGMFGLIVGRSSTLRKRQLLVYPGVIDEGWTGPLFAGCQNVGSATVAVRTGERVAQLLLLPAHAAGFTPVWGRVPVKDRGERGFGSTGA